MTSVIGPAASLERHNIPVGADLPGVGQNLQGHTLSHPSYRVNVITGSSNPIPSFLAQAQSQFNSRPPRGRLTNPGVDVLTWEKIPEDMRANFSIEAQEALAAFPADWRGVEYLPVYGYFGDQSNYAHGPIDGYNYVATSSAVVAPLSRETIDIASTDTELSPIIDPVSDTGASNFCSFWSRGKDH
ncbi:hypothetical protein BJX64DRAFT_288580 [Aspergillus heterothallicus]